VSARAHLAALLAFAIPFSAQAGSGPEIEKRTVVSRGKKRVYYLFVPGAVTPEKKAPLLVTIHGSTADGRSLVERWKDLAAAKGIVLAGPDATDLSRWASPQDGPLLLKDVVEDVAAKHAIDGRRVYLFGQSAGAVFALQMACLESEYFAAAAIHAGAVSSGYFSIFDFATRKIPIAIYIGTRDQFFPLDVVRATSEALKARDFPLLYREMPNHAHNYGEVSGRINEEIWAYFAANPLPADPKYTNYRDP
jgi:poly(3-hydroxybutyrate) depolymerase